MNEFRERGGYEKVEDDYEVDRVGNICGKRKVCEHEQVKQKSSNANQKKQEQESPVGEVTVDRQIYQ